MINFHNVGNRTKNKGKIDIRGMGWHPVVNQSRFSKEEITEIRLNTLQRGVIAFDYANIQAIAPSPNSVKPASIFISGFIGIVAVSTIANDIIPEISNLCSHSVNSGSIGSNRSSAFSSDFIVSMIDPTNIDAKKRPIIAKIIFFIFHNHLLFGAFLPSQLGHLLIPRKGCSTNTSLTDRIYNPQIQDGVNILHNTSVGDTIFHHQQLYYSFRVKKKQLALSPSHALMLPSHCIKHAVQNVLSNSNVNYDILQIFYKTGNGYCTYKGDGILFSGYKKRFFVATWSIVSSNDIFANLIGFFYETMLPPIHTFENEVNNGCWEVLQ